MKERNNFLHLGFLALALFLVGGLALLGRASIHAQDITFTISNNPPQIVTGTVKVCDNSGGIANTDGAINGCTNLATVTPNAGSTIPLSLFAKARDFNGSAEIIIASGAFYHDTNADTGDQSCTADNNDCYQLTCSKVVDIPGGGNTDAWLRCDFDFEYYADHSDGAPEWLGFIEVEDTSGSVGDNANGYATDVAKLISATFPVVDFGSRNQGFVSSAVTNLEIQHQNNGNVLIDLRTSMDDTDTNSALDCATTGSLSNTNVKFDILDRSYGTAAFTLPVEPTEVELNINILQRTNDAAPIIDDSSGDIQRTYWAVSVPAAGLEGFCQEELNVTIFEGP